MKNWANLSVSRYTSLLLHCNSPTYILQIFTLHEEPKCDIRLHFCLVCHGHYYRDFSVVLLKCNTCCKPLYKHDFCPHNMLTCNIFYEKISRPGWRKESGS